MNECSDRVDQLLSVIFSESFLEGRLSVYPNTLFMFDFSPIERPHLRWLLSLLPKQIGDRRVGSIDVFECLRAKIEREGMCDGVQHAAEAETVTAFIQAAKFIDSDSLADAILEEATALESDAVLLSGFGDISVGWSPSGILSHLNSRLPERTKLVALLPGVVDRGKFRLFDNQERTFPVFRYLRLVQ
ncbi:MAG: hypothetical protein ABGZ35_17070 [Planctomycetaceae bacterium]